MESIEVPPTLANWGINPYQSVLDVILLLFTLYILTQKPRKPAKPPSTEEIDGEIDEWIPEPLIPGMTPLMKLDQNVPLITGTTATHVTIGGKQMLNLARTNFLGFVHNPEVNEAAIKTVYTYGVGTCGPRQFYGTIDVHIDLEKRIANFMKTEDCLIFSYGVATSSSSLPAFSGRGDILVVDKGVSIGLQIGVNLSRSETFWYEHNDMKDLERVLKMVDSKLRGTPLTRRFIVFEGVSYNFGDVAPLPKIVELKNQFKYRLVMEDLGIGNLGKTGRGTCEFHNIPVTEIDILTGNLEHITGSVGGFCAARKNVVFHQRLNSTGYVYSASLPPLLAVHSQKALDIIDRQPQLLRDFRDNVEFMHAGLRNIPGLNIRGTLAGPVIHLELAQPVVDRFSGEKILQQIVDEALNEGVLLTRSKYSADEKFIPAPSIRISVSAINTKEDLTKALEGIKKAAAVALSGIIDFSAKEKEVNTTSQLSKRSTSTQNF